MAIPAVLVLRTEHLPTATSDAAMQSRHRPPNSLAFVRRTLLPLRSTTLSLSPTPHTLYIILSPSSRAPPLSPEIDRAPQNAASTEQLARPAARDPRAPRQTRAPSRARSPTLQDTPLGIHAPIPRPSRHRPQLGTALMGSPAGPAAGRLQRGKFPGCAAPGPPTRGF